jgi:hypothetical protein
VSNLLNYGLYQTGWLASVLGAGRGYPWAGMAVALVFIAVHVWLARHRRAEMALILVAGAVGLVVDSTQVRLGLLQFPSGSLVAWLCPPWIVVMWMQFATTLRYSLQWLLGPPVRAAVFGALGGPLAYLIGRRCGAVEWGPSPGLSLAVLGLLWMVSVPLLVSVARRHGPAGYRRPAVDASTPSRA